MEFPLFLQQALDDRAQQQSLRKLQFMNDKIDFCSNDYLGLAHNKDFQHRVARLIQEGQLSHGSTGSRLLSGNYPLIMDTEKLIADFHQAPAALIFNSGYDANVGLFAAVPQKGDTVIYDKLIHASVRDGVRLSKAQAFSFFHNNVDDLEKKIQQATGNIFVAVESVYSMDGDQAPLKDVVNCCEKYQAYLIVDEAHATGVTGDKGEGLVQYWQLPEKCFARIHTFGKALGVHGAAVVGNDILKNYLVNFARSFIYTTALPPASVAAIAMTYQTFPGMSDERKQLKQLIQQFQQAVIAPTILRSETPIQIVLTPGNDVARKTAGHLQENGLDVRAILHPTVPEGQERLRIVLHSFNTHEEVDRLIMLLKNLPV